MTDVQSDGEIDVGQQRQNGFCFLTPGGTTSWWSNKCNGRACIGMARWDHFCDTSPFLTHSKLLPLEVTLVKVAFFSVVDHHNFFTWPDGYLF